MNKTRLITLLTLTLLLAFGCASNDGKSVDVNNATIVPAAAAEATVEIDRNDNTKLSLQVVRLAPPEKLTPPAAVYVVWAETRNGRHFMLGQIQVDDEGSGNFTATAPIEPFRIVVSAEDDMRARAPSEQQVLKTDYVRTDS